MAEPDEIDEEKKPKQKGAAQKTAENVGDAAAKKGIQAAGAALGPEAVPVANAIAEVPLFRKIFEGGLFACALSLLIGLALAVLAVFALIDVFGKLGFENRPSLSGEIGTGGGYIIDPAFTATKTASASETMNKLSRYNNLKNKTSQIQMIIDKSRTAGINYYLLLDIWAAEQTFGNDAAAMGCGVYGGANRASGFENQVDCAIDTIKKTLNNISPYNEPAGQNRFTRQFYNYTAGMQERYKQVGYVAECNDVRLTIHRLLAPDEVYCSAGLGTGPGVALVGDKLYPPLGDKMDGYGTYTNHSTWCCGLCTSCAVDYGASGGTPIYAVANGTVSNLYPYTSKEGQYRGYTFYFDSSDKQVYATYAHLNPAGKLSTQSVRPKTTAVNKGDLLGTVYPGLNHPHLHFELKINGKVVGIPDGKTNNQLNFFGSIK